MRLFALTAMMVLTAACSTDESTGEDGGDGSGLEILGSYVDDFMGTHVVTQDTWTSNGMGVFHIDHFNNDADFLIAQNDDANEFNPSLWSRFDWADDGGQLYFCQSAFDAASPEAAEMASADATDLMMGCGGFGWSTLTSQ